MTATRVDFYQLSRDPVDVTTAKLARKVLQAGERLVVVSGDEGQRGQLAKLLWEQGGAAFLANGMAGGPHEARQPILLSADCAAPSLKPVRELHLRQMAASLGRLQQQLGRLSSWQPACRLLLRQREKTQRGGPVAR